MTQKKPIVRILRDPSADFGCLQRAGANTHGWITINHKTCRGGAWGEEAMTVRGDKGHSFEGDLVALHVLSIKSAIMCSSIPHMHIIRRSKNIIRDRRNCCLRFLPPVQQIKTNYVIDKLSFYIRCLHVHTNMHLGMRCLYRKVCSRTIIGTISHTKKCP